MNYSIRRPDVGLDDIGAVDLNFFSIFLDFDYRLIALSHLQGLPVLQIVAEQSLARNGMVKENICKLIFVLLFQEIVQNGAKTLEGFVAWGKDGEWTAARGKLVDEIGSI